MVRRVVLERRLEFLALPSNLLIYSPGAQEGRAYRHGKYLASKHSKRMPTADPAKNYRRAS